MKIIANINDINDLNNYSSCDYLVIATKYSIFYKKAFNESEIDEIVKWCILNNVKAVIKIDQIINETKLKGLIDFLDRYYMYDINFMFSDLCVLDYFIKKGMQNKLIYNAPTYICNKLDIEYYRNLNVKVMLSNELSLNDVIECNKYDNVITQVYGYFSIYYSYRDVISLYKSHCIKDNIDLDINNIILDNDILEYTLKEETREERYNIIEYKNSHSVITSKSKILLYKELESINPKYIYLDFYKVNRDDISKIIDLFKNNNNYSDSNLEKIKEFDNNVDSSMVYLKPAILGEKNE